MPTPLEVPAGIPCPQSSTVSPVERRLSSEGGPYKFRTIELDERQFQTLSFMFDSAQSATFKTWWRETLVYGGAWFSAPEDWPTPQGIAVKVRRFISPPSWDYLGVGLWRISVDCEVRGETLLPVIADPTGDPFFASVVLLLRGTDENDLSPHHHEATIGGGITFDSSATVPGVVTSGIRSDRDLASTWNYAATTRFNKRETFTLEFWLYLDGQPANEQFMGAGLARFFQTTVGVGSIGVIQNQGWSATAGVDVPIDSWHHCVLVSQDGISGFFVDGEWQHGGTVSPSLGASVFNLTDCLGVPLNGRLAEVRYTQGVARYDPLAVTIPVQSAPWPAE